VVLDAVVDAAVDTVVDAVVDVEVMMEDTVGLTENDLWSTVDAQVFQPTGDAEEDAEEVV